MTTAVQAGPSRRELARADDGAPPAAEVDAYRAAVDRGTAAFRAGRFAEARAAFELAYSIYPDVVLLFNIASCWRRAGDRDGSLVAYRRFLAAAPADDPRRPLAEEIVGRLEAEAETRAAQEAAPTVVVTAPPVRRDQRWSLTAKIGMGVIAAGAVGLAGSGVEAWRAREREEDLESLPPGAVWDRDQANRLRDGERSARRAQILGASGGGLILTGALMMFVGGRDQRIIDVSPTRGGVSVAWRTRF